VFVWTLSVILLKHTWSLKLKAVFVFDETHDVQNNSNIGTLIAKVKVVLAQIRTQLWCLDPYHLLPERFSQNHTLVQVPQCWHSCNDSNCYKVDKYSNNGLLVSAFKKSTGITHSHPFVVVSEKNQWQFSSSRYQRISSFLGNVRVYPVRS
jgi:hypothetical protein